MDTPTYPKTSLRLRTSAALIEREVRIHEKGEWEYYNSLGGH
jgi:hypothetical protein